MTDHDEQLLTPIAALSPWVSEIRVLRARARAPRMMARLPNGGSALVLCTMAAGTKIVAAGPNTRAFYNSVGAIPFYTRIAFRPGAARALLGAPLYELADRVLPVDELWGAFGKRLHEDVAAHADGEPAVRALQAALLQRVTDRPDALVHHAARVLETNPVAIHDLARALGVSERQLRQSFREEIGISPKRYARIARIRRVVAKAGQVGWARLALEHGFYDQAHLYAEFRELLGVTPRAFLTGRLPLHATA